MDILLLHLLREKLSPGHFLEKALRDRQEALTVFDLGQSPYWGDFQFRLPFYIPKGFPVSARQILRKYPRRFDFAVEVDTAGQYHCRGFKKVGIPYFLWVFDIYRADKRKFWTWAQDDFDFIFVLQRDFLDVFPHARREWLPCAVDPAVFRKHEGPKKYDISFVGNRSLPIYAERVKLLERLQRRFKVHIPSDVWADDLAKIYSESKIVFNRSAAGEMNLRVFEVMSCGSLLMTDKIENGLFDLFENKKHLVTYEDNNLEDLVEYYLKHDEEREAIAAAGRREVLAKHTYAHRAERILQVYQGFTK